MMLLTVETKGNKEVQYKNEEAMCESRSGELYIWGQQL